MDIKIEKPRVKEDYRKDFSNDKKDNSSEKEEKMIKFSSKFKSKSITESELNNNNIQEEENINKNYNNNNNHYNNNNIISIETHELIKVFQYNKKIKCYLFKIKTNNNKEENYEDFIWKEQKIKRFL